IPKRFRIEFLGRRREFITLLGGAAVTWPLVRACNRRESYRPFDFASAFSPWTAAFVAHLRERAGPRTVTSRSSIVGRRAERSVMPKLRPSSCSRRNCHRRQRCPPR